MSVSEYLAPFVGRLALGWFFLLQVAAYGGHWDATISLMVFRGIPAAPFVLSLALFGLILGSLSLILGFHTRYGAVLLFGVTIIASVAMHDYWQIHDNPAARQGDFEIFACSVAIAGGLLLLVGHGPGPLAVDNRIAGKKKK
ncbi:MAG: DoxX family membrane protein [Alphaproteobacteria bacterium]|nr:DoxX family membrane protein [Alphaproteobacteria bacterium]